MLIPLGTDRPLQRPSVVTPALVAVTSLAFLVQAAVAQADPEAGERLLRLFAVVGGDGFRPWQLVTSAFLHADLLHLAGNMLFLWVFGQAVEDRFGRIGFLIFYLAGACASAGVHALLEKVVITPDAMLGGVPVRDLTPGMLAALQSGQPITIWIPAIGASGAVAAVTGAFLVLFPRTHVRVFLWFFVIGRYDIPAWVFIAFQIAWNVVGVGNLLDSNIAYTAHLAGYVSGFAVAFLLLWTKRLPREPYDLFTMSRQAKRRRDLRAAYEESQRRSPAARMRREADTRPSPRDADSDRIAAMRAEVSTALSARSADEAASAYARLEEAFGDRQEAVTLPRNTQLELANHLYRVERYPEAARAYERFLAAYPTDREADTARLLLARAYAHALDRPDDARQLLEGILKSPTSDDLRDLARQELAELPSGS